MNALMDSTNAPEELWFLACSHVCSVLNIIATKKNNGRSAVEACLGETPDISAFTQFQFLRSVLYLTHPSFPDSGERLAHWITPAEHCGDALTYYISDAKSGELLKRSVDYRLRSGGRVNAGVCLLLPFDCLNVWSHSDYRTI